MSGNGKTFSSPLFRALLLSLALFLADPAIAEEATPSAPSSVSAQNPEPGSTAAPGEQLPAPTATEENSKDAGSATDSEAEGKAATDGAKPDTASSAAAATASDDTSTGVLPGFSQASLINPEDFGTGAFRREIKILVPPFRGLEPSISLAYQSGLPLQYSGAGAGWLGIGWQLRGIPVIERGVRGGGTPQFDTNDVYLLSGEELVACTAGVVSPSCSAGGNYTGRIEDYRKISFSSTTNYWSVWAKDGTRYEFRPTNETTPVSPSDPTAVKLANNYRWLLRTITDTHGNQVTFSYTCAQAAYCRIDAITYGGALVKFYFETRPDTYTYATGLNLLTVADRLKSIDVKFGGARARAYAVSYGQSEVAGFSRVTSVQQFGSDASVATNGTVTAGATSPLPATTFQYSAENTTFSAPVQLGGKPSAYGDFDADGKTDYVTLNNYQLKIWYANGQTFTQTLPGNSYDSDEIAAGDINGDGKADILVRYESGTAVRLLELLAPTFTPVTVPNVATHDIGTASVCCSNRLGDYNGDGRADFFANLNSVFLGNADGSFTRLGITGNFPSGNYYATDVDGDGKSDWFRDPPGTTLTDPSIYRSTGTGWQSFAVGGGHHPQGVTADGNGDGREDWLECSVDRDDVIYRISYGTVASGGTIFHPGFTSRLRCAAGDFNGDDRDDLAVAGDSGGTVGIYYATGNGYTLGQSISTTRVPAAGVDLNGDGRADLVTKVGYYKQESTGPWPNLMTSTKDVLGAVTTIAYTPSSAWNLTTGTLMPFVIPTVTSVTEDDGRGTVATSTFTYRGGKWNPVERRFLGFAGLTATRPCNAGEASCPTVDVTFSQDIAAIGTPIRIERRNGAGTVLNIRTETLTANNTLVPYTALDTQTVEDDRDGGVSRQRQTTRVFDSYGQLWKQTELGLSDTSGDERTTVTLRYPNTSLYIVDKAAEQSTYVGTDTTGTLLARSRFRYDSASSETTPPTKGDVTQALRWLNTTGGYVSASATYDGSGNKLTQTDEVGNLTGYTYDTTYHLFVTRTTNPLLQNTDQTWHLVCAQPATVTDPNSLVTTYTYDAHCRETRRDLPGGDYRTTAYISVGTPTAQYIETKRPSAAGELWARTYADGFGRTYRTSDEGPSTAAIEKLTTYAKRGTVASETLPYYAGGAVYTTTYTTDALDRVVLVVLPDSAQRSTAYAAIASGPGYDSVSVTDELSRVTKTVHDGYGRTILTVERADTADLATGVSWNLLDRMTGITDPAGNAWAYTNDSLGRRTASSDPDLGSWSFVYDDSGRLTSQTDALGQVTAFTYDGLNRILTKTARQGLPNAELTTNTYDQVRSGFHNIGRLTTATNAAATITYDNDAGGRLAKQTWTVTGLAGTKVAQTGYHASGQVLWKSWPDGDSTGSAGTPWAYDTAGRLVTIPGGITSTTYNAAGQVAAIAYQNGVITTDTYNDARGWMMSATTKDASLAVLNSTTYTRDAAGRVLTMVASPTTESWTYTYDKLDRLLTSTNASDSGSSRSFTYDAAGNMTSNSGVGAYAYPTQGPGAVRPHAQTAAGAATFTYDANGNMLTGGGRTLVYDGENRLVSATLASATTTYAYSPDGARLMTTDTSGASYLLGSEIEVAAAGTLTKLPHADIRRIGTANCFVHRDQLATIKVETDSAGAVGLRNRYTAYGQQIAVAATGCSSEQRG